MNILITGASGFIGSHITNALLQEGHDVTACVRQTGRLRQQFPAIKELVCDFGRDTAVRDWSPRLQGIDVVINAVGIISEHKGNRFEDLHTRAPIALFRACEQAGVRKVIQVSALGADDHATSAYHLSKRTADESLMDSGLDWTILRPSVVFGTGGQSTAFFRAMASLPMAPLISGGGQKIQPVCIGDLVKLVCTLVQRDTPSRQLLDVVGPQAMTFRGFLELQRQWLGLGRAWFVPIPFRLAELAAIIAGKLGSVILNRETITMLQRGNCADVTRLTRATGIIPRPVQEELAKHPATTAEAWFAQLYFMGPVLRFTLASLWIFTGLVSLWWYPVEHSLALLGQAGIPESMRPLVLHAAATLDLAIGLALLLNWRPRVMATVQILVMLTYTAIISLTLPEQWLHPFGPILKNIPLLVTIWVTAILSREQ